MPSTPKTVLILGANSDVAKEVMRLYARKGYQMMAASRSVIQLNEFAVNNGLAEQITVLYFDAMAFDTHKMFYDSLPSKPHIVVYAAGFLKNNEEALRSWEGSFEMMKVHYCGAVSILNIIVTDKDNTNLEQIIGLSSLSGVRGRRSNFIYGSTKAVFTQYLAGLRQYLFERKIIVNVIIVGYIRTKMTEGLGLTASLMLEPSFIARSVVNAKKTFIIVPGLKWKIIYFILRILPEGLVAKLP